MRKVTLWNGKNIHWDDGVEQMDFETFKSTHHNHFNPDDMEVLYEMATGKVIVKGNTIDSPEEIVEVAAEQPVQSKAATKKKK